MASGGPTRALGVDAHEDTSLPWPTVARLVVRPQLLHVAAPGGTSAYLVVLARGSAVSQHLRVLRRLRLVRSRREGKIVYHTLDDAHIDSLLQVCLEHVREEAASTNR